nr:MAG TPA: hypothetical protein [Caudoviricetes sp.]
MRNFNGFSVLLQKLHKFSKLMENRKMKCTGACVHPREGFIEIFVVFVVFVARIRKPLDFPGFFAATELSGALRHFVADCSRALYGQGRIAAGP